MNPNSPQITTQTLILSNAALLQTLINQWNKHTADFPIDRPLTFTDPEFIHLTDIQIKMMDTLNTITKSHISKRSKVHYVPS